jgi:hypothetical protein
MNVQAWDQAIDAVRAALRIAPDFSRARTKLGLCLCETGQKHAALDCVMPPCRHDLTTLDLHYRTALLYCDRIKFASSVLNLQRDIESGLGVCEADPTHHIAIVLENLGLSDTVGLMWENLCQTATHAASPSV